MKQRKRRTTIATTPQAPVQPAVRLGFSPGARAQFEGLPEKIKTGLRRKLRDFGQNPGLGKPLVGVLQGYHRITYGRLRTIAMRVVASISDGIVLVHVLWVGQRKEGASDDAYERAAIAALRAGEADAHSALELLLQQLAAGDIDPAEDD